jgi:hypothetical protein
MSATLPTPNQSEERATNRAAQAAFLAGLASIRGLDMSTLTEGDAEFDYFVRVPVSQLHDISPRISDLQFEVDCRFGVTITVAMLLSSLERS